MIYRALAFASLMIVGGSAYGAGPGAQLSGTWNRGDGAARVQIAPCGSQVCATNVWIKDPSGQGEAVGDRLVMTLKQEGAGTLTGSAHDARRGWNMSMTIRVSGNSFTSQGCLIGGMVCKSMSWTKA